MFLRVATIAALLSASLYAQTQAPAAKPKAEGSSALPSARDIINKHIKAVGGRDAILAHKSMHGTGVVAIPSQGMNGTIEVFSAAPNLQVIRISVTGIGDITEGFDGS